jgi:hypothetical protein
MPGSGPPLTPAQEQLQQANNHFASTVAEGAVLGILGGALIGYLGGGAKGAVIGAAAGGVAGSVAGYLVASNNYEQQKTEAHLNAYIQEANTNASYYQTSAAAAEQIANDLREKVAQLDAQYQSGALTAHQFNADIASYRDSRVTMGQQIAKMEADTNRLRDDATKAGPNGAALSAAADRTDQARQREVEALRDLNSSLSAVPAG